MAISRDDLYEMIQKWRNGSSKANSASKRLQDEFLDYLDSIMTSKNYDTFVVDPDTGKESGDYTPEFEATQAEVMEDLGLEDDDMDLIFNGEGDFSDFETEYDDDGLPIKSSGNPVTGEIVIDKDNDGDADVTITEQNDGKDNSSESSDKPHDTGLAGDTTLEEELLLNQNMSPEEFSKLAAKKRGAKKGEPAPDMTPGNVLSDRTQKNIIQTLSAHRW